MFRPLALLRQHRYAALLIVFSGGAFIGAANWIIIGKASSRCYDDIDQIPERDIALVLGASPFSLYYVNRLDAAAELYKAGKVRHVLVSGDNGTNFYDEATAMKEGLTKRGVSEADITCDFAGFRTYDSVVRAHKIFGVEQVTIVSQKFHNTRAVYIADYTGVDAIGYNAEQPPFGYRSRTLIREVLARTVAFVELHVTGRQPRFLGKKKPIILPPKKMENRDFR